ILAELQQRGWCERAIILTPAGLREQWADELSRRFRIRAAIFDAASLQHLISTLPAGLNPWAVEPVSITSIDFVKQPEVMRALSGAAALALSLKRRLDALSGIIVDPMAQTLLPFDVEDDNSDAEPFVSVPAFDPASDNDERGLLERIHGAAERAARDERKVAA